MIPGDEMATSFDTAITIRSMGDSTFIAALRPEWSISVHPHGGFLMALLAKAGLAALRERGEPQADPLAVSAEFLWPPAVGPVLLRADIRKVGRRAAVIAVSLEQRGRSCVEARVTAGRLPMRRPEWTEPPSMSVDPPAGAIALSGDTPEGMFNLSKGCDVRLDPATAGYLNGRTGDPPRMRLWVRPRHGLADPYFTLLAGDINPPVVFNLGRIGWTPTVQLTALLRTHPAPGWLRVVIDCRSVNESWFDSDAMVIDSQGRLVCQARQLALAPTPGS